MTDFIENPVFEGHHHAGPVLEKASQTQGRSFSPVLEKASQTQAGVLWRASQTQAPVLEKASETSGRENFLVLEKASETSA
ncbi:hypothetical protein JT354_gp14 [Serratia phage JS26]|uniref:Uncharacterized protein n=1 Tax=Serratia phage JS26 TaxID=2315217 RepID=A0A5Q2F3H4_9CAUD|nr:hypothetical protein JT354_gp14 [Serratia phage JS26]QGF20935.1 hypothetical protein [Serratia phage JS26]